MTTPAHLQRRVPVLRTEPAKRGYLVAVTCWGKPDMVDMILSSWRERYTPDDASLLFVFDSPEDDAIARYWRTRVLTMPEYHFLPPIVNEGPEWYENGSHDVLLRAFARDLFAAKDHLCGVPGGGPILGRHSGVFHTMIVWQDDQQARGNRLLNDVDVLREKYGDRLGVVGGRDGFYGGYKDMAGSPHSQSSLRTTTLAVGEFMRRPLTNRGPVIYPRHVVEQLGGIDLVNFPVWYGEADYSARAHKAGFVNGVMGVDCEHVAYGQVLASRTYEGQEAKDSAAFRRLHDDIPDRYISP